MGEQREVSRLLLHLADDQFGATPLWLIIAVGVLIVDVLIVRWSASPR
ncbi:hypothetical protein ACWGS5_15440 [Streptomyces albidoflavus]|nr:hypothetical protein [Streptomyces sp. BV333]MBV1956856.1 hypothetical protein [Streptomyces sp. BV333]